MSFSAFQAAAESAKSTVSPPNAAIGGTSGPVSNTTESATTTMSGILSATSNAGNPGVTSSAVPATTSRASSSSSAKAINYRETFVAGIVGCGIVGIALLLV